MKVDVESGLTRLTLENGLLRVQILPQVGGKIISVVLLSGDHEFIFQPPEPQKGYRIPGYGAQFRDFDNSGFDECLPTVAACRYPEENFPGELPDHGEVWSVPWEWRNSGDVLTLRSQGKHLPFNFEKTVRLNGNQLLISYKLQNTSAKQFRWLWSSHPLLTIHPGDRILLPPEVRQVFIDQSHTGRLGGFGSRCSWPIATDNAGRSVDLSRIEPPAAGTAEKYFTPRLKQGWCALHSPSADCSSCFRFDPAKVPFVGIWVNQGGWPQESALRHYTVALEPCNGAPDSLLNAVEFDQANTLGARETANWEIEVELQSGPPRI